MLGVAYLLLLLLLHFMYVKKRSGRKWREQLVLFFILHFTPPTITIFG